MSAPEHYQPFAVHVRHQLADDGHGGHGSDPSRRRGDSGRKGGVSEKRLNKQRHHGNGAVHDGRNDGHKKIPDPEVAVFKNAQIHDRLGGAQFPNDQQCHCRNRNDREPGYPRTGKPVFLLPFIQHDLEGGQPDNEKRKSDGVNRSGFGFADVRRIFQVLAHQIQRKQADGNIDVKHPAPGIVVGQPSAQQRANNGRDDYAYAKGRHCHAVLLPREAFEQNGLRQRLQRASSRSLEHAGQNKKRHGRRNAAKKRPQSKQRRADH